MQYHRESHKHFVKGELAADASAGASSERFVYVWWQFTQVLGQESVWDEFVSVMAPDISAVGGGEHDHHPFSFAEGVFAVSERSVFFSLPEICWRYWPQPQGFVDDATQVPQLGDIFE